MDAGQVGRKVLPHLKAAIRAHVMYGSTSINVIEYDCGRPVGKTACVKVSADDLITYAQLMVRGSSDRVYGRFVHKRKGEPSRFILIILKRDDAGDWGVHWVRIGKHMPPWPGSPNATDESRQFWREHALVYGSRSTVRSSMTANCPWSAPRQYYNGPVQKRRRRKQPRGRRRSRS